MSGNGSHTGVGLFAHLATVLLIFIRCEAPLFARAEFKAINGAAVGPWGLLPVWFNCQSSLMSMFGTWQAHSWLTRGTRSQQTPK